jgi:hypothetical protein
MLKDCTEARKANFSLSDVVDVSFDIDKRTILNNEIVSILQHCGDDGLRRGAELRGSASVAVRYKLA